MNSFYWLLAAPFFLIGLFQIYLVFSDQHVYFHWQNTSDGKLPLWRDGRCWWRLSYNNENRNHKYYPSPGINLSWYLWKLSPISLEFTQAGDDEDIRIGIGFLFGRIWVTLEGTRFFRWLYKNVYRMGWGYETEIALHLGYLGQYEFIMHFLYNDMSSGPSPKINVPKWKWLYNHQRRKILSRRWDRKMKLLHLQHLRAAEHLTIDPWPSWFHFWVAKDFMKSMPTGGGWRLSIDFDHIIRGSYEREEHQLEGMILNVEVPIEPDNSLGLRYLGSFTRTEEARWRSHWPWNRKKITQYWEVEFKNPPLHAGKGENSWDLDDDGIFGCAVEGETLEEAVAAYLEKCQRDRDKYGLPNVLYRAYEAKQKQLRENIEASIREVFRGDSSSGTLTDRSLDFSQE